MYIDEVPQSSRTEYKQECPLCFCEMVILSEQPDSHFAHEIDIYVQCQCGEFLKFILPVN